jgi:hypothetical protein
VGDLAGEGPEAPLPELTDRVAEKGSVEILTAPSYLGFGAASFQRNGPPRCGIDMPTGGVEEGEQFLGIGE